ncbi:hypothetical protein [Limnohabitans sp. T6-20]|uniref:hypothetical protein n=1 Tax=Limnohabitans sp. T6-20 TaxID=1100725 RepID=UPI0018EEA2E7|nr:hypothetical protein [Limnohabitans sp. T6-20]
MAQKAESHRLRTGRHSQAGQVYLLTMVTLNRQAVFEAFEAARCLIRTLSAEDRLGRASTWGRIQPVDATHSLNISAGVWKPSVLRGLSFNCRAIALS